MAAAPSGVLGGLTPLDFLSRYWQRRPLLIRGALPDFRDPLDPDELAGLACEPEVQSRLVIERGGRRPWEVVHGPQDARRLRRLARTHWTLLVQEADRHVPALADLLELFDFVPRWRLDDVMVSFAPRHGSVGAHVDSYDVFLLQGRGRRRWQVDARAPEEYRPGLDLRVLRRFEPRREWVLSPGDLLYLPPGLAHRGTSLEDAFTYSIGFRGPSWKEQVAAFGQRLLAVTREDRWRDPPPTFPLEPGEIDEAALIKIGRTVQISFIGACFPEERSRLAGELLTQPRDPPPAPRARRLRPQEVRARILAGAPFERDPASRAAFIFRGPRFNDLFVDGRRFVLRGALAALAPLLTGRRRVDAAALKRRVRGRAVAALLAELVNLGAFELGPRPRAPRGTRAGANTRRPARRR